MLPKRLRLGSAGVKEALQRGSRLSVGPFAARHVQGEPPLRLAVVVSKGVARSAVERNRLRRAAYRRIAEFTLPRGGSLVLFVRKNQ
ncbi:MAG: ribonuclease P protein component [Patescibacteria group bacterium]|nr:ribonuclease P protein component [Patescibacteria group bacterium]